jgi:capsular polysaccharide biosynthesis protein
MIKLSNINIGTKLGLMSGLGILLVTGLLVTTIVSHSQVKRTSAEADKQ